jgi:hypothetical protein
MQNEIMDGEATAAIKREAKDFPEALFTYSQNGYSIDEVGKIEKVGGKESNVVSLIKSDQIIEGKEINGITKSFFDKESNLIIQIAENNTMGEINHYGLKVHSFSSRLKVCLFNDKISVVTVIWISMMLQIFVDHFICNISGTPTAKAYCPEMTTPITLLQFRELHLQFPRGTSL